MDKVLDVTVSLGGRVLDAMGERVQNYAQCRLPIPWRGWPADEVRKVLRVRPLLWAL